MLSISWRTCLVAAGFLSWNLVIADPSYGCSGHLPKPVEWDATPGEVKMFRVNDRPVRVTVPESYNKTKPAPMIIAFHDKDQPPEHLEYDGQWTDPKVNKDVIMVYPTAENVRISYSYLRMQIKLIVLGPMDVGHQPSKENGEETNSQSIQSYCRHSIHSFSC
jgi:hypothetical protein